MLTRREYLAASSAALLSAAAPVQEAAGAAGMFDPAAPFPHKEAFFPLNGSYLNCASQHPLSRGGRDAINRYLDYKTYSTNSDFSNFGTYQGALEKYAQLINADVAEVCFVQSTTVGENLILKALGFPDGGGGIVTDELHYVGSIPTYDQLAKSGVDVTTIRTSNGRIDVADFEKAITNNTRLVAISSVSMVNGFRHDLARICEIAHARGALVYADIVHEVGSMPFDVRQSGVDFCSAASYKWLMGEQGLGFLYARHDRLDEIRRPWFGHYQFSRRRGLAFPNPQPEEKLSEYEHHDAALGYFAMGSQSNVVAALLDHSLEYLLAAGVERIQAHRQPLIDRLQEAMPAMGYSSLTPRDTGTAPVSFRHGGNVDELHDWLDGANVTVSVAAHHIRVSPSVFNDMDDIERLLDAIR
jgi:selenocysteine lyase/cysteine desulfurase